MIKQEHINFVASKYAPNPLEVTYWIDLSANPDGQIIKCYSNNRWIPINQFNDEEVDIAALQKRVDDLELDKVSVDEYDQFVNESIAAHNSLNDNKASKSSTLAGYGITDAYTKNETQTQIDTKIASLVDSAPETMNTLNELATALGDDPNFATTVANQIGTKANSSDVYTIEACNTAISDAIVNANKVTSVDINSIEVVSTMPTIQETGVLYIKVS